MPGTPPHLVQSREGTERSDYSFSRLGITRVVRTAPSLCGFVLALQRPHFIAIVEQI